MWGMKRCASGNAARNLLHARGLSRWLLACVVIAALVAGGLLCGTPVAHASWASVSIDGLTYDIDMENGTASVFSWTNQQESGFPEDGKVEIPASVAYDGIDYPVVALEGECLSWCTSLTALTIPDSVTSLGESCLGNCSSLEEVLFKGDGVETCSEWAFPVGNDPECKYIFEKSIPQEVEKADGVSYDNSYFRVKFVDDTGALLQQDDIVRSECPYLGIVPPTDVPASSETGMAFVGWDSADYECVSDCGMTITAQYDNGVSEGAWKRLATDKAVVDEGWSNSNWAIVVASGDDASAAPAAGLAGLLGCPIITTESGSLSSSASALITAKKVKNVVVVGGTPAVSADVVSQIWKLGASVQRVAGDTADETANKVYEYGKNVAGGWGYDAIVTTAGGSYQNALSIASYAYAKKAPIFLATEKGGTISDTTAKAIRAGGFTRTIIAGGVDAVGAEVESQVTGAKRLAGDTVYETSKKIAEFAVAEGMQADHMGVASGSFYHDVSVAGVALCGKMNSIVILMDADNGPANNDMYRFVASYKEMLQENCYVFGDKAAVSEDIWSSLLKVSEGTAKFLDSAEVSMSVDSFAYTSRPIAPVPSSVSVDGAFLTRDVDFRLSWGNNVDACASDADDAPYVKLVGMGDYVGAVVKTFTIVPASVADATVSKVADQTYTGKAICPEPTVTVDGRILAKGSDYTLSYANNKNPGTATVTITGKDNYTGTQKVTFTIKGTGADAWKRLSGNTAIGTMKAIVNEGWKQSDYAIVATTNGYYDALSASGLAGLLDCPILMTAPTSLTDATAKLITAKKVKNVIVVGGTPAVSDNVFNQIKKLGVSVERVAGGTAIGTANKIYERGKKVKDGWDTDAIVATASGYQDALSIAPYAYAKKAPIFLASGKPGTLTNSTAKLLKTGGFKRTIITGSEVAVAKSVESQVTGAKRLGGGTAYGTSRKIADFAISQGMEAAHMGVATSQSYYDALAGAALCGKMNSVLILADDGNNKNVDNVVKVYKDKLEKSCYIFGGTSAVSTSVENKIKAASK